MRNGKGPAMIKLTLRMSQEAAEKLLRLKADAAAGDPEAKKFMAEMDILDVKLLKVEEVKDDVPS